MSSSIMYNEGRWAMQMIVGWVRPLSPKKGHFGAMSEQNSTWDSIKTLFDPKTIPFLISQGVLPKLLPVGTALLGMLLAFIWAYLIAPTVYTGAGPVNLA